MPGCFVVWGSLDSILFVLEFTPALTAPLAFDIGEKLEAALRAGAGKSVEHWRSLDSIHFLKFSKCLGAAVATVGYIPDVFDWCIRPLGDRYVSTQGQDDRSAEIRIIKVFCKIIKVFCKISHHSFLLRASAKRPI